MAQPRLSFVTTIGTPTPKRKRRTSGKKTINIWLNSNQAAASNPEIVADARRKRMSHALRKVCLKIVFECLDPDMQGKIPTQALNDVTDELAYLAMMSSNEEKREKERFLAEHGEEKVNEMASAEQEAHKRAQNIDSTSEEEEEEDEQQNQSESDLSNFIVSDDHLSAEEEEGDCIENNNDDEESTRAKPVNKHHRKRRNINIADEDDEELDPVGTNLDEID